MQKDRLEQLLDEAKQLEKQYEWLQAAELYNEASNIVLNEKELLKATEYYEKMGLCFHKAAYQANTNLEHKNCLIQAIQVYEKESGLLKEASEPNQLKIDHANAMITFTRSILEIDPKKKKNYLDKWWTLENQVLSTYEQKGDLHSAAKTCNDLVENSRYDRVWIVQTSMERKEVFLECERLAEKAIRILCKMQDDYELARAYCLASWVYSFSNQLWEDENKVIELNRKSQKYSKKGLELSQKIGSSGFISRSYVATWSSNQLIEVNPEVAVDHSKNIISHAKIAKDNFLIGFGYAFTSVSTILQAKLLEDPDKQKEAFENAKKMAKLALDKFQILHSATGFNSSYATLTMALSSLASIETDQRLRKKILEMTIKIAQEGIDRLKNWKMFNRFSYSPLSGAFYQLSETISEITEKRELLQKAEFYIKECILYREEMTPYSYLMQSSGYYQLSLVQNALANIAINEKEKIGLLNQACISIEKCVNLITRKQKLYQSSWASGFYFGKYFSKLGGILKQIYFLSRDEKHLEKSIKAYSEASLYFKKAETPTLLAESYWNIAQLNNEISEYQNSAKNYELASEAYNLAGEKIPQLSDFYNDYSLYMQAWSQIEQARYSHSIEEYSKARQNYEKAAELHESTEPWSYLAPNYSAWASMEEAEGLSRKENTQQAKVTFQKALEQFAKAEKTMKEKIGETTAEESEMTQNLLQATNLRRKYCQARSLMEDAKLLNREGKYRQSSRSYSEAAENISAIIEKMDVEAERKELEYLTTLCRAWEKMALAEETTSAESYLEAAALFEKAKDYCYTRKASLWALGNSNFCKGLAAGLRYKSSMDLKENAVAKHFIKDASSSYFEAGYENAAEYAKATQRLFDAYLFINKAESESNQEIRAKQYQMVENLLQIAAGSFMKAKQPEKTAQVQRILASVREEKALAMSLSQVMQAPSIASSTLSFTAPSPTREASVGLESFEHANVQANLITHTKKVKVGESFCLSVEFVNAGKEPALLTRVEDFVPQDFIVVKKPEIYRLEDTCLNMKGKQIAPLKLVEAKLVLQPSKKGSYQLKPTVHYLDELGQNKSLQLKSVEIKVEEVLLADRVSTGTKELDSLLLGGIPKEYAVVLTGPPSDERELLIRNFLEAGVQEEQTSFYVTAETVGIEGLFEKSGFYLFLCNPKPKKAVPDLPNITWLKSKTDLNNLNMALVRASRNLQQKQGVKRIIIGNVSDVLLKDGPEVTRRWLSELVTDLGSKGFTILAVLDSSMHPVDQANAIINLFDGEINLTQTGVPPDCKKALIIKKLRNQDYIKNSICLSKSR